MVHQARSGINGERGTHYQDAAGLLNVIHCDFIIVNLFSEPNNVRSKLTAKFASLS